VPRNVSATLETFTVPIQTNFIEEVFGQIEFNISDAKGVISQFGLSPATVLSLCGGIPLPTISSIKVHISSQYVGALTVQVIADQFEVIRSIDFDLRRIDNRSMIVDTSERGKGIGTNLLLTQIITARQLQFIKLQTVALAPSVYDEDQDWQGYYFWANFGFINVETEEFTRWCRERNLDPTTLNELMQTGDGRTLWRADGYTWIGEFILTAGHSCFDYLDLYLRRKGIDWP
jgi:GNAT superfamily N-acetyltransferase